MCFVIGLLFYNKALLGYECAESIARVGPTAVPPKADTPIFIASVLLAGDGADLWDNLLPTPLMPFKAGSFFGGPKPEVTRPKGLAFSTLERDHVKTVSSREP